MVLPDRPGTGQNQPETNLKPAETGHESTRNRSEPAGTRNGSETNRSETGQNRPRWGWIRPEPVSNQAGTNLKPAAGPAWNRHVLPGGASPAGRHL